MGFLDSGAIKFTVISAVILAAIAFHKYQLDMAFQAGKDSVSTEVATEANETLKGKVENKNEDTISLREHKIAVAKAKAEAKRSNQGVQNASPDVDCPIDEFERMYNELKFSAH